MLHCQASLTLTFLSLALLGLLHSSSGYPSLAQDVFADAAQPTGFPFIPTPAHPVPGTLPFPIDETTNYYEYHLNGSENGAYRRSSCPAVNILANRGYINRSGKNISVSEITKAFTDVFNFGLEQTAAVLWTTLALHGRPPTVDLDYFNDDRVQHFVNCPSAPTRNDRDVGDNVNLNRTLFDALLGFSKDGLTLTIEEMAEHHHLRHNQSKAENPKFRFGNIDAICTFAQYSNLIGTFGRNGPNGPQTVFLSDLKTFYLDEDLPVGYRRRELGFFLPEANAYMNHMSSYIGFKIQRPFPADDGDGRDIEPLVAAYEKQRNCPKRRRGGRRPSPQDADRSEM